MLIEKHEKIVVALGGNALILRGEQATMASQLRNVRAAMEALVPLLERGNPLVVTHGNGFQVGNIMIRVEEALGKAYALPVEVCVAESQGELGYLIEQSLQNVLMSHRLRRRVVSVLTQVIVDANDPAFGRPTKPVGPFFSKEQAEELKRHGMDIVEQKGRGWRRLVPSPHPLEIDDVEVIQWLLEKDVIVIAAGGGGVPVVRTENNELKGVPAVIEKDLASAILAAGVGAQHFFILTGEKEVYLHYQEPQQHAVRSMSVQEAESYVNQGHFPPGSMGPKIKAGEMFLRGGGKSVLITSAPYLEEALLGNAGTWITL